MTTIERQVCQAFSSPQSSTIPATPRRRYIVTLYAPTTLTRRAGSSTALSYADRDAGYNLSILDTDPVPDVAHEYHTVVQLDHSEALAEGASSGTILRYASASPEAKGRILFPPTLRSSTPSSFSITWTSNAITGGSYCLVPLTFLSSCPSQDSSIFKLRVGTEQIRFANPHVSYGERYQEDVGLVRLFSPGMAQTAYSSDICRAQPETTTLNLTMSQLVVEEHRTVVAELPRQKRVKEQGEVDNQVVREAESTDVESMAVQIQVITDVSATVEAVQGDGTSGQPFQVFSANLVTQEEVRITHLLSQQDRYARTQLATNGQTFFPLANILVSTAPKEFPTAASTAKSNKLCVYARLENSTDTLYRAIYLAERTFEELLDGIVIKLQVDRHSIDRIYHYDKQRRTQVTVTEKTMMFLVNEDALVVSRVSEPVQIMLSTQNDHKHPSWSSSGNFHREAYTIDMETSESEQQQQLQQQQQEQQNILQESHQSNMFDEYLNWRLEGVGDGLTDSCSEGQSEIAWSVADPSGARFLETSATPPTTEMLPSSSSSQNWLSGRDSSIDYAAYSFDGLPTTPPADQLVHPASLTEQTLRDPVADQPLQWNHPSPVTTASSSTRGNSRQTTRQRVSPQPKPRGTLAYQQRRASSAFENATQAQPPAPPPQTRQHTPRKHSLKYPKPQTAAAAEAHTEALRKSARERNRIAALGCRSRRKDFVAELQEQSIVGGQRNRELRLEVLRLQTDIAVAKALLGEHGTQQCGREDELETE